MAEVSPILGYARLASSIEDIPGATRIRLVRPPAWPRIVFDSLGLPILVLATLILLLFGGALIANAHGFAALANGAIILLIALLPAAVAHQLILELRSLQRAGRRPIELVVHHEILAIDDVAQKSDDCIQLNRKDVLFMELTQQPRPFLGPRPWALRITTVEMELVIEFIEDDQSRARGVLDELKSAIQAPKPETGGDGT